MKSNLKCYDHPQFMTQTRNINWRESLGTIDFLVLNSTAHFDIKNIIYLYYKTS